MKAELKSDCGRKIALIAHWLHVNPAIELGLDAHADQPVPGDDMQALGNDRVAVVREAFVRAGVDSTRIHIGAFGERRPVCSEAAEACR
ncbi:MAG: OmpA family protein, partial [Solirubrobacteraceae bacterium]